MPRPRPLRLPTLRQRRQRLLKLADFLEKLPTQYPTAAFSMDRWGVHVGAHLPNSATHCGTKACVLGWAVMVPAFHALGLRGFWMTSPESVVQSLQVSFHDFWYVSAGQLFFGLSRKEADDLFYLAKWSGDVSNTREARIQLLRDLATKAPPRTAALRDRTRMRNYPKERILETLKGKNLQSL